MNILVLDGNENQAVASVRSLTLQGHRVSVGAPTSWSKAGLSRYCSRHFTYVAPQDNVKAFVSNIVEQLQRAPGALVLPMTERTTLPLSAYRDIIVNEGGLLVLPPHDTLLRAFDKQYTTQLAQSKGISVPRSELITCPEEAMSLANVLRFPIVLKPRSSEEVRTDGVVYSTGSPIYSKNKEEYIKAYKAMSHRCQAILVQEYISGSGTGYFALMRNGELCAEFAHKRIRDVHPTGSGSALRVSAEPDLALRQASLAMLNALKWHGVAMVEFKRCQDGTLVFMEINGRFWNSLPLAIYAGVDFPSLLAELAEFGEVKSSTSYQSGVRCRWLLGDFRHLIEVFKGAPNGYPGHYPKRWKTLLNFLVPVPGTMHDNFLLHDPMPEFGDWADFFLRRLPEFIKKNRKNE